MFFHFTDILVIFYSIRRIFEFWNRWLIRHCPECCCGMSCRQETILQSGLCHRKNLFQTFFIIQFRCCQNLFHHTDGKWNLSIKCFPFDFKSCLEFFFFYFRHIRVKLQWSSDSSGVSVDFIKKFSIFIMLSVNDSENCLQKPHHRKILFRHIRKVKHQIQITDPVRLNLMEYHRDICNLHLFIINRCDLSGNIRSCQHRDLLQILLTWRFFLILL